MTRNSGSILEDDGCEERLGRECGVVWEVLYGRIMDFVSCYSF